MTARGFRPSSIHCQTRFPPRNTLSGGHIALIIVVIPFSHQYFRNLSLHASWRNAGAVPSS